MRWSESPLWQSFSGEVYFEHRRPCDGSLLTRFRRILGEEGVEELLAQTVNVAVDMKVIDPRELESVIVDSTVQEKAVAYPTDSRLLERAREKLVDAAKEEGVELKQTYAKEGRELGRRAVLCAAGYNIRWLMRMILKHGIRRFLRLIFARVVRANEGYFPRNLFWNLSWT